jgi:hypothetical protein
MPYKAAKAVAATFCYNIRYALTPIFGKEFLSMCIHPKDPNYAKFLINPTIVRECTEESNRLRVEGIIDHSTHLEQPTVTDIPAVHRVATTPRMKFVCPPWGIKSSKVQRTKPSDLEVESGYGTDEDPRLSPNSKGYFSPEVSPRSHTWTSVNNPQSPVAHGMLSATQRWLTSVPTAFYEEPFRTKRTHSKVACNPEEEIRPSTAVSLSEVESVSDAVSRDMYHTKKDLSAAEILLSLSVADTPPRRVKRSRRSSKF